MVNILIGTNRPRSRAGRLATHYANLLTELGEESQVLNLTDLPADYTTSALYSNAGRNEDYNRLAARLDDTSKLVIIVPEYNGSFPGVLKAFLDGLPYPGGIRGKKAALVGLSNGGQGGLLAMSHLSDILMYLGTAVLPQRVRLPFIEKELTETGELINELPRQLLREQAEALLAF